MKSPVSSLRRLNLIVASPTLAGGCLVIVLGAGSALGVDRIKQNNTTALNLAGSWDTLPGSGDVAVWNSTVAGANSSALGGALSWQGVRIANPGGLVTVGTSLETSVLTLGTSGIDMTAATQNLLIDIASESPGGHCRRHPKSAVNWAPFGCWAYRLVIGEI